MSLPIKCCKCQTKEGFIYEYNIRMTKTGELAGLRCGNIYFCNKCINIARKNHPEYSYSPLFPNSSNPEEIADFIENIEEPIILFLQVNELKKQP